jgi:hypothetical protein
LLDIKPEGIWKFKLALGAEYMSPPVLLWKALKIEAVRSLGAKDP